MCDRGIVELDPLVRVEIFELLCGEVRAVVGDDAMDLMKLTVVEAVELVIGMALIHLVNFSTATSK